MKILLILALTFYAHVELCAQTNALSTNDIISQSLQREIVAKQINQNPDDGSLKRSGNEIIKIEIKKAMEIANQTPAFQNITGDTNHNNAIPNYQKYVVDFFEGKLPENLFISTPVMAAAYAYQLNEQIPQLQNEIRKKDAIIDQLLKSANIAQSTTNSQTTSTNDGLKAMQEKLETLERKIDRRTAKHGASRNGAVNFVPDTPEQLSIQAVMDDGKLISMDNGSIWQVEELDAINSMLWLPLTDVTVIDGDGIEYPYKLVNTEDNEIVNAKRIK